MKVACERGQTEKSAVAKHFCSEEHRILWNDTNVIQRASRTMELVMKEALCIKLTPVDARFNRDDGYELLDLRSVGGGGGTKRTPTSAPDRTGELIRMFFFSYLQWECLAGSASFHVKTEMI